MKIMQQHQLSDSSSPDLRNVQYSKNKNDSSENSIQKVKENMRKKQGHNLSQSLDYNQNKQFSSSIFAELYVNYQLQKDQKQLKLPKIAIDQSYQFKNRELRVLKLKSKFENISSNLLEKYQEKIKNIKQDNIKDIQKILYKLAWHLNKEGDFQKESDESSFLKSFNDKNHPLMMGVAKFFVDNLNNEMKKLSVRSWKKIMKVKGPWIKKGKEQQFDLFETPQKSENSQDQRNQKNDKSYKKSALKSTEKENDAELIKLLIDEHNKTKSPSSKRNLLDDNNIEHANKLQVPIQVQEESDYSFRSNIQILNTFINARQVLIKKNNQKRLISQSIQKIKDQKDLIDKQAEKEQNVMDHQEHPENAESFEQIVDENLEQLLRETKSLLQFKQHFDNKTEDEIVQKYAVAFQESQKKSERNIELLHLLHPNKIDYLVAKFVQKLQKKLSYKQIEDKQQNFEKMIRQIVQKKNVYFNQFRENRMSTTQANDKNIILQDYPKIQKLRNKIVVQEKKFNESSTNNQQIENALSTSVENISQQNINAEAIDQEPLENTLQKQQTEESKVKQKQVMRKYIDKSIKMLGQPLPILTKIQDDGFLPLLNYQMNNENTKALINVFPNLIPFTLNKIYLVNNSIKDENLSLMIDTLSLLKSGNDKPNGLSTLAIILNNIAKQFYTSLSEFYIRSESFKSLKKLVLKDPNPKKDCIIEIQQMCKQFSDYGFQLNNLRKLCLSRIGLDQESLRYLSSAVKYMQNLNHLDISANSINAFNLANFVEQINGKNKLKSLNLAFNSGINIKKTHFKKVLDSDEDIGKFEFAISNLIHKSQYLLHLDLSGLGMKFKSYKYIAEKGIRKSRTLLAIHLSGMYITDLEMAQMRAILKINFSISQKKDFQNYNIFAKIDSNVLKNIFVARQIDNQNQIYSMNWQENNLKFQAKQFVKKPFLNDDENNRIVYQRILGQPQILNSHQWSEDKVANCKVCLKYTFCILIWNIRLAKQNKNIKFFRRSKLDPFIMNKKMTLKDPLVSFQNQVHSMISLKEFMERLQFYQKADKVKITNNENEMQKKQNIQRDISNHIKIKGYDNQTFWDEQVAQNEKFKTYFDQDFYYEEMQNWQQKLLNLIPQRSYQFIDIIQYQQEIQKQLIADFPDIQQLNKEEFDLLNEADKEEELQNFKKMQIQNLNLRAQNLAKETFLCALYLPDSFIASKTSLEIVIKCPQLPGVEFLKHQIPRIKSLSVNTLKILPKQIKKVKVIRYFTKSKSVFAKFIEDTPQVLKKCFEHDSGFWKIPKFIRDEKDKKATYEVLKKYYSKIKNQFLHQIATIKSYPVIDWLDFCNQCQNWKIVDQYLTQQDIDRIFIATNFEQEDNDDNDDDALCRYEFIEIIARMAKEKYYEKGRAKSINESCEMLIQEYLIPNSNEKMQWQEFRDSELWTLEIDDLIKANLQGIKLLHSKFSTNGQFSQKLMQKDDILDLQQAALGQNKELFQELGLNPQQIFQGQEKNAVLAYSLSKMTLADEFEDIEKYNKMVLVEFYEFLGRWAYLIFQDELYMPLYVKYQRILQLLLPLVPCSFIDVLGEGEITSDSDYDDDIVNQVVQEYFKKD